MYQEPTLTAADRARFAAKVSTAPSGPDGQCREWKASRNPGGYGRFGVGQTWVRAHRAAWYFATGEWPSGDLLHACDNPSCVLVAHLRVGTAADNQRDMDERDRRSQGERHYLAKLTDDAVRAIRRDQGRLSCAALARRHGVSKTTVYQVQTGKVWRHVA